MRAGQMTEVVSDGIKKWKLRRKQKSNWNKIAQYDNTAMSIACFVDGKTGRAKSGLTKEDAVRLEEELGLEKNELAPRSRYWIDFHIKCDDELMHLDLDDPEDELIFLFLKSHKLVAFTEKGLKKKPHALYVLFNDEDEARVQNKARNVKKDAYVAYAGMSTAEMIDVLMVMGERIVSVNPSIVEAQMGRIVEKRPADFMDIFDDQGFKSKLFIMKCVYYDLIQLGRGKSIYERTFTFGSEYLGTGVDEAAAYIEKTVNQRVYLALEKQVQIKQSEGTLAGSQIISSMTDEATGKVDKGEKRKTDKKITSNAGSGKGMKRGAGQAGRSTGGASAGEVKEIIGEGNDSGEYDQGEEVI